MDGDNTDHGKGLTAVIHALRTALAEADALDEFVLAARINDALADACELLDKPPR